MASVAESELAALLAGLSASPSKSSPQFNNILNIASHNPIGLLQAIPKVEKDPAKSLGLLSSLLTEGQAQLPVLDVLRCYSALRRGMPEAAKAGKSPEITRAMDEAVDNIHNSYRCLSDLIEDSDRPVLLPPEGPPVTQGGLKRSVRDFKLPLLKDGVRNPVVAVAVPNGPLLAATCVAVTAHFTNAPINPAVGPEQFRADVEQVQAQCILTTPEMSEKLMLTESWVAEQGIEVFYVDFSAAQELTLTTQSGHPLPTHEMVSQPNKGSDICLVLFTSGTSGKKKIVPFTLHLVVFGAMLVIDSWGLTSSDICLNMMPLFHIGGLLRNIFAPILAGGSTVCCSAFDPGLFWSVAQRIKPTWYYASPTMHTLILSSAPEAYDSRFRLICNAAGGLLPSLALQLQDVFGCTVLPSYGMTECMPISTPPLTYKLDRTGTSGIVTGPDLTILDPNDNHAPAHAVGRISVRGDPVFGGYLKESGELDRSPFNESGWFDTGDMGYLDEDGYLYVTGRSKEVINRGGEIISPFEVENAIVGSAKQPDSPIFGRVKEALAFSVKHDVLQEVVGAVLVTPDGMPRVDIRVLQEALKASLQQAKWPVVVIFMDGLPKRNNKVLRIKIADRTSLPTFDDDTPYSERHWEAACPPEEALLTDKIPTQKCLMDEGAIVNAVGECLPENMQLDVHVRRNLDQGTLEAVTAPSRGSPASPSAQEGFEATMLPRLLAKLDNYLIPHRFHTLPEPLPRLNDSAVDASALETILLDLQKKGADALQGTTEGRVIAKFAEILQCDPSQVRPDADFFSLGGDSLKAGKLIAALRTEFSVAVPIGMVFADGTPRAIGKFIEDNMPEGGPAEKKPPPGCHETYSSTRWWLMLLQLVPMVCVYPLRRGVQWTFFMVALSYSQMWLTSEFWIGRLVNLVVSILFAQVVIMVTAPWFGIAAKWLIIGRYKEGLYPMWGPYHTRWWMVQKIISVCGYGFFGWSSFGRIMYYRLMGAKIGKNVSMSKVKLGEFDLIEIRDGAILEKCMCRPFAAEWNTTMYLGRIVVGRNATVGTASIIAPGTEIPDETCVGPNSSSWELEDATEANRDLLSAGMPKSHWALSLLITAPLYAAMSFLRLVPWMAGLIGLVMEPPTQNMNRFYSMIQWFAAPHRVGFHYLALVLRAAFGPFIAFGFAVIVKKILDCIFGKLEPSPAKGRSQVATWRMELMRTLMPTGSLHDMTEMFGQHYEATSVAVRLLGGKVGKRVYWPGTGPSVPDYHLIDIGDDVVFGSRSHLTTSDATGAERIKIGKNAMIADRVTLLPGVEVGEGTTMGSGALTRRNASYDSGATYVGSKGGDAVCLTTGRSKQFSPDTAWNESGWNSGATTPRLHSAGSEKPMSGETTPRLFSSQSEKPFPGASSPKSFEYRMDNKNASDQASTVVDGRASEDGEISPFGRAFYLGKAPYHVLGPFAIFCYSTFLTVITKFYWNVPSISSIQITNVVVQKLLFSSEAASYKTWRWTDPFILCGWMTLFIAALTTAQAIIAVAFVIGSKWALLGRRQPGNYDWDKSSYCQRWQIFLGIERLRRSCFRGNGILGMLTSTHWVVMYFRAMGADIGKDCALFANGDPSLYFTEPDLLSLGDRVVVDDASLVGHVNSRGTFDLNRLAVGDRCVLRSGSRLLSGADMKSDACLMEHTLVMGGDVVGEGETMQGWPAGVFRGDRVRGC